MVPSPYWHKKRTRSLGGVIVSVEQDSKDGVPVLSLYHTGAEKNNEVKHE